MKNQYLDIINLKLKTEMSINNNLATPKITKVVINVGVGQSKTDPNYLEFIDTSIKSISGQKPIYRRAHKAISGFKIRQGDVVGMMVTLRGKKMVDFIRKLANISLPRMRDFRGLKMTKFDNQGNYNMGIAEHIIFHEISHEKAEKLHGLSIAICTNAKTPALSKKLLEAWGFPFMKEK